MTIAAGFVATDGILLFADTQFTGCDKTYGEKIIRATAMPVMVHFAISGDIDYAKSAIEDCREAISLIPPPEHSIWNVRKSIRRVIKRMLSDYDGRKLDSSQSPEFLVSIGTNAEGVRLFSSRDAAMSPVEVYDFRGSGASIGNYIMQAFGPRAARLSVKALLPLALHVLSAARRHDAYCGGGSQFVTISGVAGEGMTASTISTIDRPVMDQQIRDYEYCCGQFLARAMGNVSLSDEEFRAESQLFLDKLAAIRSEIGAPESDYAALLASTKVTRARVIPKG